MIARTSAALLAVILVVGGARTGQAAGADPKRSEARERYERGKQLYEEQDYNGALAEFKAAQQLISSPVTLLNIARVYVALNRPVDAVVTLEQLLANPGSLKADQIELATRTRDEQKKRVARLAVTTNVAANLEIDGLPAGRTPLSEPLRVASGTHIVTAIAGGFLPARKEVTVAGESTAELKFELEPSDSKAAHLTVKTALPDAEVVVDGQVVGKTPLPSSLTLVPGHRSVELRRAGYVPARKEITLGDGASGALAFDLEEDPASTTEGFGYLVLAISENEAEVTIDGRPRGPYKGSLRLPPGAHLLRVDRGGFEPTERLADVRPRAETLVRVTLQPTPDTRLNYVEKARRQQVIGWTTAGVGTAIAAAATVLVLTNSGPLDDAKKARSAVDIKFQPGGICDRSGAGYPPEPGQPLSGHDRCDQEQNDAYDKVNRLETKRTIGLIGIGVGAAGMITGIVLLIANDNPHKYDHPESELALTPQAWVDGRGFRVGFEARF
jgi:hypothetical protein